MVPPMFSARARRLNKLRGLRKKLAFANQIFALLAFVEHTFRLNGRRRVREDESPKPGQGREARKSIGGAQRRSA